MFKRTSRRSRSAKHTHAFNAHNVGAHLERQVCRTCGQISIHPLPPTDLRAEVVEEDAGLFTGPPLTVRIDEAVEPVLSTPRSGERRSRR